jgi:hypothetical protein
MYPWQRICHECTPQIEEWRGNWMRNIKISYYDSKDILGKRLEYEVPKSRPDAKGTFMYPRTRISFGGNPLLEGETHGNH